MLTTSSANLKTVSIDAPFKNRQGEDVDFLDAFGAFSLPDADNTLDYREALGIEVQRQLQILSPFQRDVIQLFFGIGFESSCSIETIAEMFGKKPDQVRYQKKKAIEALRESDSIHLLKQFLGK